MLNFNTDVMSQIKEAIKRPEGTFEFECSIEGLFDPTVPGGILLELTSGAHIFILERTNDLEMKYYHSSPGTGTRVATVDLKSVKPSNSLFLCFTWATNDIKLYVASRVEGAELIVGEGKKSKKQLRVGRDGSIIQVGDEGVDVIEVRMTMGGQQILEPTAIEAWNATIEAVSILQDGKSDKGYIYEVVTCNLGISTLVTGFETYCKKRFIELEQEGITPNISAVADRKFSQAERDAGEPKIVADEAAQENISFLEKIARSRINFQNYDDCKRLYNKAYGVRFGEMGIQDTQLDLLKKLIKFRHRIIHVSPLLGSLNLHEIPVTEPIFSNNELLKNATNCCSHFVSKLHEATLRLKRLD